MQASCCRLIFSVLYALFEARGLDPASPKKNRASEKGTGHCPTIYWFLHVRKMKERGYNGQTPQLSAPLTRIAMRTNEFLIRVHCAASPAPDGQLNHAFMQPSYGSWHGVGVSGSQGGVHVANERCGAIGLWIRRFFCAYFAAFHPWLRACFLSAAGRWRGSACLLFPGPSQLWGRLLHSSTGIRTPRIPTTPAKIFPCGIRR